MDFPPKKFERTREIFYKLCYFLTPCPKIFGRVKVPLPSISTIFYNYCQSERKRQRSAVKFARTKHNFEWRRSFDKRKGTEIVTNGMRQQSVVVSTNGGRKKFHFQSSYCTFKVVNFQIENRVFDSTERRPAVILGCEGQFNLICRILK